MRTGTFVAGLLLAALIAFVGSGCSDDDPPVDTGPECPTAEIVPPSPKGAVLLHQPLEFFIHGPQASAPDTALVRFRTRSGADTTVWFAAGEDSAEFVPSELGLWDWQVRLRYGECPLIACAGGFDVEAEEGGPCWMSCTIDRTRAVIPTGGHVDQRVTIRVPPGAVLEGRPAVHWEGPETLEPTFLPIGPDEDGIITARYGMFDRDWFVGHWTAHVVVFLACQDSTDPGFYAALPFEVVRADTLGVRQPLQPSAP